MANLAAFTMSDFKMLGATAESGCNWKPEWIQNRVVQGQPRRNTERQPRIKIMKSSEVWWSTSWTDRRRVRRGLSCCYRRWRRASWRMVTAGCQWASRVASQVLKIPQIPIITEFLSKNTSKFQGVKNASVFFPFGSQKQGLSIVLPKVLGSSYSQQYLTSCTTQWLTPQVSPKITVLLQSCLLIIICHTHLNVIIIRIS